jgi:hypothetical protein
MYLSCCFEKSTNNAKYRYYFRGLVIDICDGAKGDFDEICIKADKSVARNMNFVALQVF